MGAKLTNATVKALKAGEKDYIQWDAGDGSVKGFGVRVWPPSIRDPQGRKVFVVQFRTKDGTSRRLNIGRFPDWSVDQARDEAKTLIRGADKGGDAKAERDAAEKARRATEKAAAEAARLSEEMKLRNLAERFMSEHVALKRKGTTQAFYRIVLDKHVMPALGDRDARSITRRDVARLHTDMADKPTMANRALAVLGAIYSWADRVELLPEGTRNPVAKIEKFKEEARERFLSVDELARLGEAIRAAETEGIEWHPREGAKAKHAPSAENRRVTISPQAAAALRLLIFTGARLREILHLTWDSVDTERGLIRLRDSKVGKATIILNAPARAVLAGLPRVGRYVIPGEIATGPDGTTVEKPRADLKRPWALVTKAAGLPGLRIHDLRHSFASVGAGDGHGLTIVGRLLNHSQQRTMQRYQHLGDDPLRKASDAIATRIADAMGEAPAPESAKVIPIRKDGAA